jgi:hypothetical protein
MTAARELLAHFHARGIRVVVEVSDGGPRLRIGPRRLVTMTDLNALTANRAEVIETLTRLNDDDRDAIDRVRATFPDSRVVEFRSALSGKTAETEQSAADAGQESVR